MGLDLTRIAPADLVRLVNSTRLGRAITERQLYRHRMAAGLRIGDRDHIHLLRYACWLASQLESLQREANVTKTNDAQQYEQHKARAAKRQAEIAEAGQEIGPPPDVVNPARREACRHNFRLFCETYFAAIFRLAWSEDHLRVIKKIERAVLHGELFAIAMPRGSGKTSLCEAAVCWAILFGHHKYVCLIAATERRARKLLQVGVWSPLEKNPLLYEDFPEVCHPVRSLERTSQKARKQKIDGKYTDMLWTKNEIVLPTVYLKQAGPDGQPVAVLSPASGTIVTVCGLTGGEILGQNKDMPDGSIARPSLVLLDDPQTRDSAKSPTQTRDRIELLQGGVLGMAGPDKTIAGMMPCTVIKPGDMADEILDTEKHPEWHGERTRLVYAWPKAEDLWDEYAALYRSGLRKGDAMPATEFYRRHRAAMDAGSKVAWPERFVTKKGEISALQHAMNLRIRDAAMFASEFQNDPLADKPDDDILTVDQIAKKLNGRDAGTIPAACSKLVMFIDPHQKLLYYAVVALERNFTGYVVEYGTYPDQRLEYFAARQVRRTLAMVKKGVKYEAALYAGLEALTADKLGRSWPREDGATMRIPLCLIDAGWSKPTVELFCRQTRFAGVCNPSKGIPIKASSRPLDEGSKQGEDVGENWKVTLAQGKEHIPLVQIDANYWKTFLHERLSTPIGSSGCLSLYGRSSDRHRLIAEHLVSEPHVATKGRGRDLVEWLPPVGGRDNHWFDCLTGCMAAGSILGCTLLAKTVPGRTRKAPAKKTKAKYF